MTAYVQKFLIGGGTGNTNVLKTDGSFTFDPATWAPWSVPNLTGTTGAGGAGGLGGAAGASGGNGGAGGMSGGGSTGAGRDAAADMSIDTAPS